MNSKTKTNHYYEIDFIKTFAITSVILLHILVYKNSNNILFDIGAPFHIWQVIPLFILVFGFTYRLSIEKGYSLINIIVSRFLRLFFPLIVACILSFLLLFSFKISPEVNWHIFLGKIPLYGNGVYFITLYLESMFFFVLLYFLILKYNKIFVVLFCILLSICGELISYYIDVVDPYLYSASFHRYIVFFIFGYYYFYDFVTNKNKKITLGFLLVGWGGIFLMYHYQLEKVPLWPYSESKSAIDWGFQHFPYAIYTLFFSFLLIYISRSIHKVNILKKMSYVISNATLHIFLLQIFIFNLIKLYSIEINLYLAISILIVSVGMGILWNKIEDKILNMSHLNKEVTR